jgi:predicted DCC family thiol-disulfide oxidoreductase YuxK
MNKTPDPDMSPAERKAETNGSTKPTVLYDGGCPLCSREIEHYRRLRGAESVDWVDITQHPAIETAFGVPKSAAMARFHVRNPEGVWLTGAWAFAELWSHLKHYRLLATIVRRLRLVALLDWGYVRFARWRLRRRCDSESCSA